MAIRIIGEFTQFHADRFARALSSAMTEQFAPPGVEYTVTAKKREESAALPEGEQRGSLTVACDMKTPRCSGKGK
nr:MAG TPA: hypothetical protein [Caudoviricetes sp.]